MSEKTISCDKNGMVGQTSPLSGFAALRPPCGDYSTALTMRSAPKKEIG